MQYKLQYILAVLLITSCGKKKSESEVSVSPIAGKLHDAYKSKLAEAKASADPTTGWLEQSECDGMLWTGKYNCGGGEAKLSYAEYPDVPGKFNRRPPPYCGADFGNSATTWSRDMGMGLIASAWCTKDRDILERHASYGTKKNWIMGEPFADGRVVYTPSIIGILYQAIYSLGGSDTTARSFPSIYSSGLVDFEAHLQMVDIWLRGEFDGRERNLELDATSTQWSRIKEHSDRQANCPFYQYMRGIYEGSLERPASLLLQSGTPDCDYVRGGPSAIASEWLFVARLTLKKMGLVE